MASDPKFNLLSLLTVYLQKCKLALNTNNGVGGFVDEKLDYSHDPLDTLHTLYSLLLLSHLLELSSTKHGILYRYTYRI